MTSADRSGAGHQPAGEQHYRARLTAADVVAIRQRAVAGEQLRAIHADYAARVGWSAIQKIAAGTRWQIVDGAPVLTARRRPWTETEWHYLVEHPDQPAAEIGQCLGRSARAIAMARHQLKGRAMKRSQQP